MELEKRIKLIKQNQNIEKSRENIINQTNKKKPAINENSPIIQRLREDEERTRLKSLSDDELIERNFKEEADALRANLANITGNMAENLEDIKDYIKHNQTPQSRNLSQNTNANEHSNQNVAMPQRLNENLHRTPLPKHNFAESNAESTDKQDLTSKIDLSDIRLKPQDYADSTKEHNANISQSITQDIAQTPMPQMPNSTTNIISDLATQKNSNEFVGIYTPPNFEDGKHHSIEIIDKIDNYDIEFPKIKALYDDILGSNNIIDSTDDIDTLNEINNSLVRAQKKLEERLKIAKIKQKLGDIKSITPIESEQDLSQNIHWMGDSGFLRDLHNDDSGDISQDFNSDSTHLQESTLQSPQTQDSSDNVNKIEVINMDFAGDASDSAVLQAHFQSPQTQDSSTQHSTKEEFGDDFFDIKPRDYADSTTHDTSVFQKQTYFSQESNDFSGFKLPSLDLLDTPLTQKIDIDDSEIDIKVQNLFNKLRVFKIEGDIVRTYSGPVVTTFEFRPAANVKVSRIQNLQDDLSMALKATSIRIQAPIPGKDVVGIEIPNNRIQTIYLREIFESDEFRNSHANLAIALGKDVIGNPVIEDLATLPHLLIAGTTGSGKSVGINAMILSLIYKNTPKDLRFIMIDPKFLEFGLYKDIPHLLTPIITDPKKAIVALSKAVDEMNRRYELMDRAKVKTIVGYNELAKQNNEEKLPYIVIIIDEFADLMMMGGREAEQFLISLAGKARASGIHLIIATQRPTVNVVTGLIKGNLPSKISYRVGSKIDSKVILDETGAEALLGRGDLLFSKTNSIVRLHAPYNNEKEIERVVDFLKSQQEVEYDEFFSLEQKETTQIQTQISSDGDYLQKAKEIMLQSNKTSISYLQRTLNVGFNKAATIVDTLEKEGFLSAPNHRGIREILG